MSAGNPLNKDKALTAGVSFKPGSLLARAKAYGAAQIPVLGYSAVVSQALDQFLTARGWGPEGAAVVAAEEIDLLLEMKRLGLNPRATLAESVRSASIVPFSPQSSVVCPPSSGDLPPAA